MKPTYLIMMDKLFDVLLDSGCQYFIEDFLIKAHHGYWPEIFFLVVSLPGFGIRMMLVSKNELGRTPFFVLFGIVSEGMVPGPLCTSCRFWL